MNKRTLAGFLMLSSLIDCNSDGSRDVAPVVTNIAVDPQPAQPYVHFEGIWQGTLTSDETQSSSAAIAMVNGWGELRLVTNDRQFVGFPARTASTIGGNVIGLRSPGTTWADGSSKSDFILSGSIAEDEFIDASYEGKADSGSLAMAWSVVDEFSEIETIDGIWALLDENQNNVATIQIDKVGIVQAKISGGHANGCNYIGDTESWTSIHSYDVTPFVVTGCPLINGIDLNGSYAGTGALIDVQDDNSEELLLIMALSNESNQLSFFLHKVSD